MPPKKISDEKKQQERMRILECALRITKTESYASLSMRKIASTLGYSATKIYSYFHNKDEIYIATVVESYKLFYKFIEDHTKNAKSGEERLYELTLAFLSFSETYSNQYSILFEQSNPKFKQFIGTPLEEVALEKNEAGFQWYQCVKSLLSDYIEEKKLSSNYDLDIITMNFISIMHGAINLYHNKLIHEVMQEPSKYLEITSQRIVNEFERVVL